MSVNGAVGSGAVGSGAVGSDAAAVGPWPMVAVVPVRKGALPAGGAEAVAEAGGRAIVVGDGTEEAATGLTGAGQVLLAEWGPYAPGRWAADLASELAEVAVVVLPASADGRDLAPRLAHVLDRPLLAGAMTISADRVVVVRHQERVAETHLIREPVVATLLPGIRGVDPSSQRPELRPLQSVIPPAAGGRHATVRDATVLEVLPPDPATMDLSEATRVLAGGAGLGRPDRFELLSRVAAGLGATPGATRVVSDAGWVPGHRYIGTTGVSVTPELYIAVGISGAVQHVTGIGHPDHIVAVNTDSSAPMMVRADLAVVTDGPGLLAELALRLDARPASADR